LGLHRKKNLLAFSHGRSWYGNQRFEQQDGTARNGRTEGGTVSSDFLTSAAGYLEKGVRPASRFFSYLACAALYIMPIPVFVDVLLRYAFAYSIPGGIELQEFLMLMLVFFGFSYVEAEGGGNIQIGIVLGKLKGRARKAVQTFIYTLSFLIVLLISLALLSQGIKRLHDGEISMSLELPVWVFWFLAGLAAFLLAMVLLIKWLKVLGRASEQEGWGWSILAGLVACVVIFAPIAGFRPPGLSSYACGVLGMIFLFSVLFLGVPIGFGMTITGFLGMIVLNKSLPPSLAMLGIGSYDTGASYMLTVVPLFILMGQFAFNSGISKDLFEAASKWFGRVRGGIAMSAVAGCAGFAAVCGDSLATAVTLGTIAIPEMKKKNYNMALATGSLAAGGTLGILIPPSVGFIFYGIVTEESIGKLFVAGIIPGIVLALLFILYIALIARLNPQLAPQGEPFTFREKIVSLKGTLGMLTLLVLILGGILTGLFNAIEGGAVGAIGVFIYAVGKRRMSFATLVASLKSSLNITCKLLLILMGVTILGYFLAGTRLPFFLADVIGGLGVSRYVVFAFVIAFFLILGCLLNVIPMILLVLPTIFPMIVALGFDPIWFGVVCVVTMEAGQITPPVGVNVFAISTSSGVPMYTVFKGILPFFLCMLLLVVLLVIFPGMATWLPSVLF
jgi:tripartite ATP-independent transporter DctM subunit